MRPLLVGGTEAFEKGNLCHLRLREGEEMNSDKSEGLNDCMARPRLSVE